MPGTPRSGRSVIGRLHGRSRPVSWPVLRSRLSSARWARTAGQSAAVIENRAESRGWSSAARRCAAKDALVARADAAERAPRPLVAGVGVEADALHVPRLEGERQHQPLHLGVRARADRRPGQPGVADLAGVGPSWPCRGWPVRPGPPVQVEQPRRTDRPLSSASRMTANGAAVPAARAALGRSRCSAPTSASPTGTLLIRYRSGCLPDARHQAGR